MTTVLIVVLLVALFLSIPIAVSLALSTIFVFYFFYSDVPMITNLARHSVFYANRVFNGKRRDRQ